MSVSAYPTLEKFVKRYRNHVSKGILRNWRSKKIDPSFLKIGKAILHPVEELERWDRSNPVSCGRMPIASSGARNPDGDVD